MFGVRFALINNVVGGRLELMFARGASCGNFPNLAREAY